MGLRNNMPLGDHKVGFEVVLDKSTYYGGTIDSLSHKMKNMRLISRSHSENHSVALMNPKIVKRKDISNGENLFEVSKDEGFNIPLNALHRE
jgi:hypothetical protein